MDPSNLTEKPAAKTERKSGGFLDSILDSVLSVPETVMDSMANLAITSFETIDEMVSGFAKSVANLVIPEPKSQPSKA